MGKEGQPKSLIPEPPSFSPSEMRIIKKYAAERKVVRSAQPKPLPTSALVNLRFN